MNVAAIQMSSVRDIETNLVDARTLAKDAVSKGARWLVFPENAPYLGKDREKIAVAETLEGPMCQAFAEIASSHNVWVTLGSFPEVSDAEHTFNTCVTFSPSGDQVAVYRKMHLFDVQVDAETTYRESDSVTPGNELVTFEMEGFNVGVSVCYDLRFPEMYRALVDQGANVLIVPSAFTMNTGRDHWHALLRARAIENQCYVIAPDQYGNHYGDRWSFGQSAIYDPWGRLLASCSDGVGVATATMKRSLIDETRGRIPCLDHRKF